MPRPPRRRAAYRLIVYARDGVRHTLGRGSYDEIMALMGSSRIAQQLAAEGWTAWEFKRDRFPYEH